MAGGHRFRALSSAWALLVVALALGILFFFSSIGSPRTWARTSAPIVTASIEAAATDTPGKIAFTSNRDGNYRIYVMNADGTGKHA
ncbi:MAG: hypothetical protein V1724_02250 [Chloroflexota bacterium]